MQSTPSSRARASTACSRMPVSTLITTRKPLAAASSTTGHAHAVAIGEPVRDVSLDLGAQHAQRREQHHHRHRAIHIVVTVNQDFFVLLQSAAQTRDGLAHAGHELRRVEVPKVGVKKCLRRRRFRKPPLHKQARYQRRYFQLARQAPGRFCVDR